MRREYDPYALPDSRRVRLDVERMVSRFGLDTQVFHQSNIDVDTLVERGVVDVMLRALSRDAKVETTTREETSKTTEKNRTYNLVCRGPLPVTILDHLKLSAYLPVARYVRWAKQQERYRNDGGRPYGIRFCRSLVRHLKPRRRRVKVTHATVITNRIENRVVQDVHVHRHVCPHIPVPESNYQLHASFLCEPDHRKHYLIAFARELVRWAEGKDASMYEYFDRGGNVLGYAKALCEEYR